MDINSSKLPSVFRFKPPRLFFPWIGVAAVFLGACSGALPQYATSIARSPELKRPLIDARRCLETIGFEMRIIDVRSGLISGETFELADDRSPTVVVSEVSIITGDDSVSIIAHSRRASSASRGWKSVRISERVRRAVDQLADRLGGGHSGARLQCESFPTHEGDELAWDPGSSRRGSVSPAIPLAMRAVVWRTR